VETENKKILKFVFLVLAIVGLIWFLIKIRWVLELMVASLLIVYILSPFTAYLEKKQRFSHTLAVAVVFTIFLLVIVLIISLFIPLIEAEMRAIVEDIPAHLKQLQYFLQEVTDFITSFEMIELDVEEEIIRTLNQLPKNLEPILAEIANISLVVFASLVNIFFILFIVLYLLYDFESIKNAFINFMPPGYKQEARDIINFIDHNFGNYIRGNIIRCTLVGILTGIALFIIGMPYSFLLGVLAGILNIILYIGPYIAAVPAILLSISPTTPSFLSVVLIYLIVQALDGTVLSPILLGRAVKLKPVTVIVALLIGGQLGGFMGMILSVPLAGTIKNIAYYYREKKFDG
jgi:predicted PurR-regulated permease PerM